MNGMPRRLVLAMAIFAAAALLFGYAMFRALTIEPASAAPLPLPTPGASAKATEPMGPDQTPAPVEQKPTAKTESKTRTKEPKKPGDVDLDALLLAVDADPFREDRARVGARYRMPGEEVELPPEEPPPPPPPPLRVVGTLVTPNNAVAIVQLDNGQSRVVGVGESVAGYRIDRIAANNATVSGAGQTVTLPVQLASRGSSRATPRGTQNTPTQEARAREQQVLQLQSMQRALEQLRAMGNGPEIQQAMQQIMRQMENISRQPGATFEIRQGAPPAPPTRVRVDTMMTTTRNRN